jgi:signal peptide peptidase-like protein 2B
VAVMISSTDGATLQALPAKSVLSIHPYARSSFDASIVFLLIIAVATVVAGAYWSSAPERADSYSLPAYRDPDIPEDEVAYMTPGAAIGFIFCASFGLVILFYFINALIYILFIIFGFGGASALVLALSPLVRNHFPQLRENVEVRFCGNVEKTTLFLMVPCYGLALWWFIARKSSYSWVLQDILGISLLLSIQRTLRLPNIKVSAILLCLAFVYDIFWVFISPLFFQSSVMYFFLVFQHCVDFGLYLGSPLPLVEILGKPFQC